MEIRIIIIYRTRMFTGKFTTRKIHTKLHPGLEWCIFRILTSEDIDDFFDILISSLSLNLSALTREILFLPLEHKLLLYGGECFTGN